MAKEMFGEVGSWGQKVDDFLKKQEEQNNDPELMDNLINTPFLDMPLKPFNPKAIEDRQIKIDAQRQTNKDLKDIQDNPEKYVQDKIDLYNPEPINNLKQNLNTARAMGTVATDKNKKDYKFKHSKKINTWQLMLDTASPEDRPEMKKILNREYYKRGSKNLSEKELKFIGKHPSQLKSTTTTTDSLKDTVNFIQNINEIRQLHKESKAMDDLFEKRFKQYKEQKKIKGGLAYLMGEFE